MSDSRPKWTLSEAAERTGISRSTLRRRLDQGKFPGAYRDQAKQWRIPLTDLLAAGITPVQGVFTDIAHPENELAHDIAQVTQAPLEIRVMELENALSIERAHRAAAEQVALAHEQRAKTAEMALRMLESGRPATPAGDVTEQVPAAAPAKKDGPPQRPARWWNRRR